MALGGEAAHQGRGAADGGELRQAAGAAMSARKSWKEPLPFGLPDDFDFSVIRSRADVVSLMAALPNADRGVLARKLYERRDHIGNALVFFALMDVWDHDYREVVMRSARRPTLSPPPCAKSHHQSSAGGQCGCGAASGCSKLIPATPPSACRGRAAARRFPPPARSQMIVAVYWLVDEFLAHHFSVRPILNGDLAHFERSPVGMIGIDAVNNERLVV